MDHKQIVAGLGEGERRALTRLSDGPGLVHLALHLGAILLGAALILHGWWWVMPLQGVLIVFLFTLLHETVHQTPFASRWLNVWVGRLCGVLLALPPEWFRHFHLAHHRFTNDPERDPELTEPKPATWRGYLAYLSGLPTWAGHVRTLFRNARGLCNDSFVPARALPRVRREARVFLALYALVAIAVVMGAHWIVQVWLLSALLGQPVLRLYLLAEHGRCPPVANMLENTRTTFTTWAVRKLAWNMPYHAEHHAYPTVPFHQLPAFHTHTRPHLKVVERGYHRFHRRVIRALAVGEGKPL
ncbi:MAG: fatty acid desaturase [Pseudomonadota bacterium]